MIKVILLVFCAGITSFSQAQNTQTDSEKSTKVVYKYIGIQANLLLRQFISFNSNSSINTNPYIFTYSVNNIKTGRGVVFGTGFNISENSSNDGVSSVTVKNANATFRIGFEKKYLQEQRFIPFWGVEAGMGVLSNRVESSLNQTFNNNTTVTETTKAFFGPCFRAGLNYSLSKHVQLGTEFFLNSQIAYSKTINGNGHFTTNFLPLNIGFEAPTALFLILKY
ncbi:MAG: hypothetical protein H7096_11765 [Flavobacterium sp.]|nr:hypothetical protein [Pedobacter sp.]